MFKKQKWCKIIEVIRGYLCLMSFKTHRCLRVLPLWTCGNLELAWADEQGEGVWLTFIAWTLTGGFIKKPIPLKLFPLFPATALILSFSIPYFAMAHIQRLGKRWPYEILNGINGSDSYVSGCIVKAKVLYECRWTHFQESNILDSD